jgi:hypothetical protein
MGDVAFPSAFLFQTRNILNNFARRTQRGQMMANTTFLPGGQMQTELPSAANIDLDSFCILAKITYGQQTAGVYQSWPASVGAFIRNLTVSINGETFQSTDYTGELQTVLSDFSYGQQIKNRMGVMQLGNKSLYKTSVAGAAGPPVIPTFNDVGQHDDGTDRWIAITASDMPGFMSTVTPRVLQTGLIGPVVISIVLNGPDILGLAGGSGIKVCGAVPTATDAAARAGALVFVDGTGNNNTNLPNSDVTYLLTPGNLSYNAAAVTQSYKFEDTHTLYDVLSLDPTFTQFNQMALATGRAFEMPFQNWNVMQYPLGTTLNSVSRFAPCSSNLTHIMSWFLPDQSTGNRYYDEVTRRSSRYNRALPDSWQFTVSGVIVPSMVCEKVKYSWPVFLSSLAKMHDSLHAFHPGLTSYTTWAKKFGVMAYRFDCPDEDGKTWYSGLSTQNQSIQCFVDAKDATPLTTPNVGSQMIAWATTKIINVMANKSTSQVI